MDEVVLKVNNLHTHFLTRQGTVKAVNGVSFTLKRGGILGIVGESGCGKTVTALSILRLVPYPGRIVEGEVYFEGRNLMELSNEELRHIRGKDISMVFQDPTTGLNPVIPVGAQVEETITSHLPLSGGKVRHRTLDILRQVGLPTPERVANQYPFQLSGGMCQRVMIAIAMALGPKVLIADELTSSLDVTLQAELLNEVRRLKEEHKASIILITHDLGVIAQMADDVAVMYAGSIVEYTDTITLFRRPAHPYTWALLRSLPRLDDIDRPLVSLKGSPPNLIDLPDHCAFLPRCNKARNECRQSSSPKLQAIASNHLVACYNQMLYAHIDEE